MGKVVADISMSVDGFVRAPKATPAEPLGVSGERLHDWAFHGDDRDRDLLETSIGSAGAVVGGRRTYDDSLPWWGADGPTGPRRLPLFVVTHQPPSEVPENGVYTFVSDLHDAVRRAKDAAGDRCVSVMGGADVIVQCLRAGLVDEISLHVVPVLFGGGLRLFDSPFDEHIALETIDSIRTPSATHLRYRVRP
jgi:dihydrofolate reductase